MMAHLTSRWYSRQYDIPKGEEIKMRCCSKEGSDVIDFIIASRLIAPNEYQYKLYKVVKPPKPIVQLIKVAKDPLILEDYIFGK